ncbi:MAG: membrane protein insertion efficiency factor YidD [Patescibacteria group bacterium]|mgnify:CR=1 FL=1
MKKANIFSITSSEERAGAHSLTQRSSNSVAKGLILFIRAYQKTISPDKGIFLSWRGKSACRFYPSCSDYAIRAIEKHGIARGIFVAAKRIARCTPRRGAEVDEP